MFYLLFYSPLISFIFLFPSRSSLGRRPARSRVESPPTSLLRLSFHRLARIFSILTVSNGNRFARRCARVSFLKHASPFHVFLSRFLSLLFVLPYDEPRSPERPASLGQKDRKMKSRSRFDEHRSSISFLEDENRSQSVH